MQPALHSHFPMNLHAETAYRRQSLERFFNTANRRSRARGFTLIELLVVVFIIAILVSTFLPAVQSARESARKVQCKNNLKQLGLALHSYHDAHDVFPMGSSRPAGAGSWGYAMFLMPFLDHKNVYDSVDFDNPDCCLEIRALQTATPPKADPASFPHEILICPSDINSNQILKHGTPDAYPCGDLFPGNYLGVSGDTHNGCSGTTKGNGLFFARSSTRFAHIKDGQATTLMLGERAIPKDRVWGWLICGGTECEHYISSEFGLSPGEHAAWTTGIVERFWSWHKGGGTHFVFADGSVRFLNYDINLRTLQALSTKYGKEPVVNF